MERPAHTALFQSIWNHPAEENGQNVNLGSWGGGSFCGLPSPLPLLVAAIIRAPANYRVVHLVIFLNAYFPTCIFFYLHIFLPAYFFYLHIFSTCIFC